MRTLLFMAALQYLTPPELSIIQGFGFGVAGCLCVLQDMKELYET